jgi:hypothetical protein
VSAFLESPTKGSSPFFLFQKSPKGSSPRAPSPGFDPPLKNTLDYFMPLRDKKLIDTHKQKTQKQVCNRK